MRNILSKSDIEDRLPLLAVENGFTVSKNGDITAVFRVELPEIFTLSRADYQAVHATWVKAIKVLPAYTVLHKQDWFTRCAYVPFGAVGHRREEEPGFLERAYERHFAEREYMQHTCYLYVTATTKESMRGTGLYSSLCRTRPAEKDRTDETAHAVFADAVAQMESILSESGYLKLRRMGSDELLGTRQHAGLIERYLTLSGTDDNVCLQDIAIRDKSMRIGQKVLCLHTLSSTADLPQQVATDSRLERWSTTRTDCLLSFAAPVGVLLPADHIYNQYVFIEDSTVILRDFERQARNLNSLSRYSRVNGINRQWLEEYLNEAHSKGLTAVRCHANVMAWTEDERQLSRLRTDVGSALARMECTPRHNTTDVPALFWAGIPGAAGDFPAEESFYTFPRQAACLFANESCSRDSLSPFGIRLADRLSGRPLHVDISDEPMKRGVITNRNKFILGPSGSGKSFFTNHMVRQYYEQGTHILLVDTGHSYQGLCALINRQSGGKDGLYFTCTEEEPIAFNPFFVQDGVYDIEKRESLKTLLLTLWKREDEAPSRAEEVALSTAVSMYLNAIGDGNLKASFNGFYEFVRDEYRSVLRQKKVREKDFDIENFLNVLEPYYRGGEYDYLLNSDRQPDLLDKRFIVFELDNIRDHAVLLPVVTLIIMDTFISKMRRLNGVRRVYVLH